MGGWCKLWIWNTVETRAVNFIVISNKFPGGNEKKKPWISQSQMPALRPITELRVFNYKQECNFSTQRNCCLLQITTNHQTSESRHATQPRGCPPQQPGLGSGWLFPGLVCPTWQHAESSRPASSHDSGPDTAAASIKEHKNNRIKYMNNIQ